MATDPEDIYRERYKNVTDLRQYDKVWKVTNDGTNGTEPVERIWEICIAGKYGQIYPSGFNGDLSITVTSPRVGPKVSAALEGHRRAGQGNQGCAESEERAYRFPNDPKLINELAKLIGARRSRKGKGRGFTPEQIAAGAARLKAWRESKKAAKQQPVLTSVA